MYIGNLQFLYPAIYLSVAAVVVLLMGVAAAKRPDKGLDHWIPTQYLAPALMLPGVILAGAMVWLSLHYAGLTTNITVGQEVFPVPSAALFITQGGHAQLMFDPFAAILGLIAFIGTLIVMVLSLEHFGENQIHKAEYYSLMMLATVAAYLAAASSDLIAIYLSIEFLSLVSYILAAYSKTDRRSAEAGLKYFLYGAACSAISVYGMSIIFGVTGGSTALSAIAKNITIELAQTGVLWVGILFTLVGLGFKLALVPFHFWAPDTYEGAPTPVTAFLSVVSKAAGLAVIVRFLATVGIPASRGPLSWYWILFAFTIGTMFYGNMVAIWQRNIKRMLAYSSIAQVGYIMIGVLTSMHFFASGTSYGVPSAAVRADITNVADPIKGVPWDLPGVLIYMVAYLFMNLGAFAVVVAMGKRLGSDRIESYTGLMKRSPYMASALAVFLVSLAGVPPTAGFLGKLFIFGGAIKVGLLGHQELLVLALLGVINSVISAYYYLNVVRLMFFVPSTSKKSIRTSFAINAVVAFAMAVVLGLIIFASPVSKLASNAIYTTVVNRGNIIP